MTARVAELAGADVVSGRIRIAPPRQPAARRTLVGPPRATAGRPHRRHRALRAQLRAIGPDARSPLRPPGHDRTRSRSRRAPARTQARHLPGGGRRRGGRRCSPAFATCCPASTHSASRAAAPMATGWLPGGTGCASSRGPRRAARPQRAPSALRWNSLCASEPDQGALVSTLDAPATHLRENPFELAQQQLRLVGDTFDIDPNLISVLSQCKKAVSVSIPTRMDDGYDHDLPGLSRHPQHRARPVEGRHPLPPGRHARRGEVARDVDDVEVRPHGHSVRRREGRRRLRSEAHVRGRAPADDPPLHLRDHHGDRPGEGHPRAGRGHGAEGDGVDLRHVLDEQGPLGARRRHRQAARDRRVARPAGGDRARRRCSRCSRRSTGWARASPG